MFTHPLCLQLFVSAVRPVHGGSLTHTPVWCEVAPCKMGAGCLLLYFEHPLRGAQPSVVCPVGVPLGELGLWAAAYYRVYSRAAADLSYLAATSYWLSRDP